MPIATLRGIDLEGDVAGQPVHAARRSHQADARLGQAERGVIGGDDDVARERDLEAATEREAVHRGDDRLPEIEARGDTAEAGRRHAGHAVLRRPLEVVARGEGLLSGSRENCHPGVGIGREVVPRLRQLLVGIGVEGVHHLRAVDGDPGDVVALLVLDELECHPTLIA